MIRTSLAATAATAGMAALLTVGSFAAESSQDERNWRGRTPPERTAPNPTRIEADNGAGIIRFYIKGEMRARLDADGLHVVEGPVQAVPTN